MDGQLSQPATDIRREASIQHLLERMPQKVADSFTDTQLIHLKTALGARSWGQHTIDIRGTLTLPLTRWRYYYVFLYGRNRRRLSDRETRFSRLIGAVVLLILLIGLTALGLLIIYLLKSFAGIDLFPDFSLGIWDYFKENLANDT